MKTITPEVPRSNVPSNTVPSSTELLARVRLTPADHQRAEASLRQGEALADLMLGIARTVRGWVEHHQQHATDPRRLKSAS